MVYGFKPNMEDDYVTFLFRDDFEKGVSEKRSLYWAELS